LNFSSSKGGAAFNLNLRLALIVSHRQRAMRLSISIYGLPLLFARVLHCMAAGIGIGENAARQHVVTAVASGGVSEGKLQKGDIILMMESVASKNSRETPC
jgi:hypothetical protein